MATNEVLLKHKTQFLFRDPTDFDTSAPFLPATAANSLIIPTPTEVDIDLTALAASGGARASDKFDFLSPWPGWIAWDACLEFESAPADGGLVEFYLAGSPNSTAGTGNPGLTTGTDTGFADTIGNLGQLRPIGVLTVKATVINIGHVGIIMPTFQYGILVVVNQASVGLRTSATAMDETHIVGTPVVVDIAAAA